MNDLNALSIGVQDEPDEDTFFQNFACSGGCRGTGIDRGHAYYPREPEPGIQGFPGETGRRCVANTGAHTR